MQLGQYNHIFFGLSTFDSFPQRDQGIAFDLASRGANVDFVEIIPSAVGYLRQKYDQVFRKIAIDNFRYAKESPERFSIHVPPRVPTSFRNSITPGFDRKLFRNWFERTFRDQDWERTIVWNMYPLWWKWYVDRSFIDPYCLIYDIADDYDVFGTSKYSLQRMKEGEQLLAAETDIVTYAATEMRDSIQRRFPAKSTFCLPNALSNAFVPLASEPRIVNGHQKKIGFVGSLESRWMDTGLLVKVAAAFPENEVVVIGPMDVGLAQTFASYPNVTTTGFVDHEKVVTYLRHFDVALIPFKNNNITRVVNPLKLYEYASAGIPIVSIRTDELKHYNEFVYLSDTHDEFLANIKQALDESDESAFQVRKAFSLENTWHSRLAAFQDAFEELHPDRNS
jgi:glycosyl transferase family 1